MCVDMCMYECSMHFTDMLDVQCTHVQENVQL